MKQLKHLKTKNPVWLASSHFTENIENLRKCCEKGAGAIILKGADGRITEPCGRRCRNCRLPDSFHGRRIFRDNATIYSFTPNSLLCEFLSLRELESLLKLLRKDYPDVFRIVNISARNPQALINTTKLLRDYGAQALEFNLKYTLRYPDTNITDVEDYVLRFLKKISGRIDLPFILKIPPNHGLLKESFLRKSSQYVNGFTITNGLFRDLPLHFRKNLPQGIKKKTCSVVGEPLWELVKKYVPIAKKYSDFVSASGGIYNGQRVKEIMDLGADSVQLCSGIELYGYGLISTVKVAALKKN